MKHRAMGGVVLVGVMLASMLVSGTAQGNTYQVRNDNDSGPGSLRAAITAANGRPGADVVSFAPSVRDAIDLRSALPPLRAALEVRGPGADKLAVQRSYARNTPNFRVFTVAEGSFVTISGLKISNGSVFKSPLKGGGILSLGKLTLRRVTVSGSYVCYGDGGGLYNEGGSATVVDSTFVNNSSDYDGAAIGNSGTLKVENSTFLDNDSYEGSSGIYNTSRGTATVEGSDFTRNNGGHSGAVLNSGDLTVRESTFSANTADFGDGGAIDNSYGDLSVERSTFTANKASYSGGAIHNTGEATVENSTLFSNETDTDVYPSDGGGGIHNSGRATVVGSTVAGNRSPNPGSGIKHAGSDATDRTSLRMTVVADNTTPGGPDDVAGSFVSEGYNLVENPGGATGFGPTDIQNADPVLDPEGLKDNGGPTRTMTLLPESPAIDAVGAGCRPPATDQRGVSRPQDGDGEGTSLCDIGAFELNPSP